MKEALTEIFSEYGNVIDLVAKKNLKAKGQAFVVFDDVKAAETAIQEVQGFELFDKPMILDYAKTRSDATVEREGNAEELEAHKRRRLAEKGMDLRGPPPKEPRTDPYSYDQRESRPMKHKKRRGSLSGLLLHRSRNPVPQDRRRLRVVRDSSLPTPEQALLCRKNTFPQTRFSSYRTYQTTTTWMVSLLFSAVSRASERYDWCPVGRESLSWSTTRKPEPSVRRRTRRGWLWEKRTRSSKLYINGNDVRPWSALWGFLCKPGCNYTLIEIFLHCTSLLAMVARAAPTPLSGSKAANHKKCKIQHAQTLLIQMRNVIKLHKNRSFLLTHLSS